MRKVAFVTGGSRGIGRAVVRPLAAEGCAGGIDYLQARDLALALERELRALPDHQREILVMREVSGLSYQEIGELLSLDLGTVKSRIARARGALRKILLESGNLSGYLPSNLSKPKERGR